MHLSHLEIQVLSKAEMKNTENLHFRTREKAGTHQNTRYVSGSQQCLRHKDTVIEAKGTRRKALV